MEPLLEARPRADDSAASNEPAFVGPPADARRAAAARLPVNRALTVEEITSSDALEALREQWAALWREDDEATPFQSPEWMLAWWRHLAGQGLWTLAVRRAGELVGLAPLFVWTNPGTGERQVTLLGTGVTDHLALVTRPDVRSEVAAAVLAHLADHADRWDIALLQDLSPDSPLVTTPAPNGIASTVDNPEVCPTLAVPEDADGLRGVVSSSRLKRLRYCRRRAERMGDVVFERADGESIDRCFDALLRLHGLRWAERGEPGVLDDPRVEAFHREVCRGFAALGTLRLYVLSVGGRQAAAFYGFQHRGRLFYYLGGFDPAMGDVEPGTLVIAHAVEQAVREGVREVDFLRGREPYKYAWGAADRAKARRTLRPTQR